ncbi:MAG: DJ-1/PfpI family protein [Deltaproteobacteria bacterium]|nr:MAG: DJ-1/PfpI family protein [Deltaproteobacteria bacterium]
MRAVVLALCVILSAGPLAAADHVYVCPMEEHPQEFDHPGKCPLCGMELVEKAARLNVAVLLFDGAEIIDYAGPYEVLGQVGARVFTVAPTAEPIKSVFGLAVKPDFDFEHAPPADVLLVPGGGIRPILDDPKAIEWVRQRAGASRYVLSVCNGAFILAKAGLLEGLSATTTASNLDRLAATSPRIRVIRDKRFADNGKIITSAGLSAGIDGALHLVERIYGRVRAEDVARDIEYHWQPESNWARGALADAMMPDVQLPDGASWRKLVNTGDTDRWEVRGELKVPMQSEEFLDLSARQITASGWTLQRSRKRQRTFVKKDSAGRTWRATFSAAPANQQQTFVETMTVEKTH